MLQADELHDLLIRLHCAHHITVSMASLHEWQRLPGHPAYVRMTRCITEAFLPHICIWWQRRKREVLCNQETRMAGSHKGIRAQITMGP